MNVWNRPSAPPRQTLTAECSCSRMAVIQPDGMFGFGEKKPAFDQQAHDTAHRRGKRRLPARDTQKKPRERQTEARRKRHAAQGARVPPRQLEAEFAGQKSAV